MVVYALFEDVAGVDEVEAICRVPGIDGVAVGAYDLAASMGHPGEPWREDVQAVVERVLQTCRRNRMPFGTVPRDRADLGHQIARGCQLITVAILEWGIQATGDAVAELSALACRLERRPILRPRIYAPVMVNCPTGPGVPPGPARRLAV